MCGSGLAGRHRGTFRYGPASSAAGEALTAIAGTAGGAVLWIVPMSEAAPLGPYYTEEAYLPRKDEREADALVQALAARGVTAHVDGPMSTIARWVAFRVAAGGLPQPAEMDDAAAEIGTPHILEWMDQAVEPPIDVWADEIAGRATQGHSAIGVGSFGRGRSRITAVVSSRFALDLAPIPRDPTQPVRVSGQLAGGGAVSAVTLPGPARHPAADDSGLFDFTLPAGTIAVDLVVGRGLETTEIARLDLAPPPGDLAPPDGIDVRDWVRASVDRIRADAGAPELAALPFVPCGTVPDDLDGVAVSRTQLCYGVGTQSEPAATWSVLARRPNVVWLLTDARFDALGVELGGDEMAFHLYRTFAPDPAGVSSALAAVLGGPPDPGATAIIEQLLGAFESTPIEEASAAIGAELTGPRLPFPGDVYVVTLHAATADELPDGIPADWPSASRWAVGATTGRLASGEHRQVAVLVVAD